MGSQDQVVLGNKVKFLDLRGARLFLGTWYNINFKKTFVSF